MRNSRGQGFLQNGLVAAFFKPGVHLRQKRCRYRVGVLVGVIMTAAHRNEGLLYLGALAFGTHPGSVLFQAAGIVEDGIGFWRRLAFWRLLPTIKPGRRSPVKRNSRSLASLRGTQGNRSVRIDLSACRAYPCVFAYTAFSLTTLSVAPHSTISLSLGNAPRAQPPKEPAQRAKLPEAIAKAQRHAAHSREASGTFSEACTAYLRILSRIGAIAFGHLRRAALRSSSQFIAMPARYEFADLAHIAFSLAGRSGAAAMALAGALR